MRELWERAYGRVVAGWEEEFARNREVHGARIQCRAGCDSCCHQLFQITELEAAEVSRGVQALSEETRRKVQKRSELYLEERAKLTGEGATESWGSLGEGKRLPCPALENGQCLIYDHRPLICRKFGIPLYHPDRPGRLNVCKLNFGDGEVIDDGALVQIQTELHYDWKSLQLAYNDARGWRDPKPLTVARAIVEDCSGWFPPGEVRRG